MAADAPAQAHLMFWRTFARLLSVGVALTEALAVASTSCMDDALADALAAAGARVKEGDTFSGAMAQRPDVFAEAIVSMVEAGERTGKLDSIAGLIAEGWEAGQWPACAAAAPEQTQPSAAAQGGQIFDAIVRDALAAKASELHLEPLETEARVRRRIDGMLLEERKLSLADHVAVVARIKSLAGLDVAERRLPQGGHILLDLDDRRVDLRVHISPNVLGETVALRLLDKMASPLSLAHLGLSPQQLATLEDWRQRPSGLIVVTGPAGSGRTTTLYSMLSQLNLPDRKLATVESPVELVLEGVCQMDASGGMSYADAVQAQLRQDPDVLMIGELHDDATAWLAVQAAMTGRLVLTTLHTTSAAAGLRRLVDMGISPYLVNDTLVGVVSQRLVRVLCGECKSRRHPDDEEMEAMALPFHMDKPTIYDPASCERCHHTGYLGRTGVFEVLEPTEKIARALEQRYGAQDLHQVAVENGMKPLHQEAIAKVVDGLTSLEEALRTTRWG